MYLNLPPIEPTELDIPEGMRMMTVQPLSACFSPEGFSEMCRRDPQSKHGRYDDICGPNIHHVMAALDWSFASSPVTICLIDKEHGPVAYGFAAAFRNDPKRCSTSIFHGINLSYAVHSAFAGRGYGLTVACLAMQEADRQWGGELSGKLLNVQTRAANAPSNALIKRLSGGELSPTASFTAKLPRGKDIAYVGARSDWDISLARAEHHLLNVKYLQENSHQNEAVHCEVFFAEEADPVVEIQPAPAS